MVVKVYISGSSGNKAVKANQRKAIDFLTALGVKLEIVDISQPELSEERDLMLSTSKPGTEDIGKLPLCPQFFNDQLYCGDYDDFDIALENDSITEFLKLTQSDMVEGKNLPPHDWGDIVNGEIQEEKANENDLKAKENGHLTDSSSSSFEEELNENKKGEAGDKVVAKEFAEDDQAEKEIISEKKVEIESSKDEKVITPEKIVAEEDNISSGNKERSESSSSNTSSSPNSSSSSSSSSEIATPKKSPEPSKKQTSAKVTSQENDKITPNPNIKNTKVPAGGAKGENINPTLKSSTGNVKKEKDVIISTPNVTNTKEITAKNKSETLVKADNVKQTTAKETPPAKPKANVSTKKASETIVGTNRRDSTSSSSSSSSTSSSSSSSSTTSATSTES